MTTAQQFQVGSRVCLVCDPARCGQVVGFDGDAVLVAFRVGEQIATGRHSPDALDTGAAIGQDKFKNSKEREGVL